MFWPWKKGKKTSIYQTTKKLRFHNSIRSLSKISTNRETSIAPENRPSEKETIAFQLSIFRCKLLVSGRVQTIHFWVSIFETCMEHRCPLHLQVEVEVPQQPRAKGVPVAAFGYVGHGEIHVLCITGSIQQHILCIYIIIYNIWFMMLIITSALLTITTIMW